MARVGSLCWLFVLVGCGREIAQTASWDPEARAELETSCATPLSKLPPPPEWATGELAPNPLITKTYGPSDGPGLFVTARDAFRVYLNGALILESSRPRTHAFVPLTLLPGDNRLAIAVWAEQGTPAALLQLDDLTESYLSDASWRAETTPQPGFSAPGYDDEAGEAAVDLGRLGSFPGCDPAEPFPQTTLARWIGPARASSSSAVLRRVIRVDPVGFGQEATGGDGAPLQVAATFEELEALATATAPAVIAIPEGDYDFRRRGDEITERPACPSACSEDTTKLIYRFLPGDETCPVPQVMVTTDARTLKVASDKTLVGLGRGATLRGLSLDLGAQANIVVRNLALYDINRHVHEAGDAIGMAGARDVWIDHVTTKWISDGHTDISPGTENVTLSWVRYDGANPAECRGRHTHVSTIASSNATVHHTLYDHADSHAPLIEGASARGHVFNNLVQDNEGYGVAAACGAQVLLEGTTFRAVQTPTARRDCSGEPPMGAMDSPAGSNLYLQDVGAHAGGDGNEPGDAVFEAPYFYRLDPAGDSWPRVFERAGAGGPWQRPLVIDP